MIKAVISDFDGTLCDTQRAISTVLVETFRARGQPAPDAAAIAATLARGITLEETFAALEPALVTDAEHCAQWVKLYREIYNGGLGVRATVGFPGVADTLAALGAAGVPVVIVSNKGERAVEGTLRHLGLDRHIHTIIAASGALATKPDPRSFTERIAPLFPALEPAEFLVLGDTPTDIRYARAIGAQSGWVSFGYGADAECLELGPDHVIDQLTDLVRLVECAREPAAPHRDDGRVVIVDAIDRRGPASAIATYARAFCQPGLPRSRTQALVARMTEHVLRALDLALVDGDVVVPVARAGMAMWPVATARYAAPETCFAVARKDKAARRVEVELSTGATGATTALILDTVSATGDTVVAVAAALRQRAPGCRIAAALCYAAPQAVEHIVAAGVIDRLAVGVLATGVQDGWLVPRTQGDVGDKLFGPGPAGPR